MTLKIYGIPRSRTIRTLWMAKELGVAYEHVPVGFGPEGTKSAAFLAINPFGQVPAIEDDGLVVTDSLAINLYLARKYGGPMGPADAAEDSRMLSWGFWAATSIEPHAANAMYHTSMFAPEKRRPEVAADALERILAPLESLEAHLSAHGHLVGGRFTVADLNLVGCLFYLRMTPAPLADKPAIRAWYEAALARPAAKAAFALRGD